MVVADEHDLRPGSSGGVKDRCELSCAGHSGFVDDKDVPVQHKDFGERAVVMRDAKNPEGPILYFTEAEWDAFIAGVKDGEFDDLLEEDPTEAP